MSLRFSEFTPKSWVCLKEGYSIRTFLNDLLAGITVGIISLPLTMAFAIASGVSPEKGLITGIIAGFLISLLGGSRVQIGGPTGAFAVIIYSVVMRHGVDGLILATLLAGLMMIAFALARAGAMLKFIPYSVTAGFTAGIALIIFSSQIKDFFGLQMESMPIEFLDKWQAYAQNAHSFNPTALTLGALSLIFLFGMRRYLPKWPAPVFVVFFGTLAAWYFQFPIETVESKFGTIPSDLPPPSFPDFSLNKLQAVFPDAITIALLGAIESLLSAVIADGLTGHRHRSNTELMAQGIANIGSALFGGIPATGAIARTAANIRLGAKTPIAGMIHAVTMAILVFFFAYWAAQIPLTILAAVLIYIAWNMSEIEQIKAIFKTTKSDITILIVSFLLTIFVDLTVAVQAGVLIAAVLFMKKMTDATSVKGCQLTLTEKEDPYAEDSLLQARDKIPENVVLFELDGPLFFGSSQSLSEIFSQIRPLPQTLILRMHKVPLIDASGLHALIEFSKQCEKKRIRLILSEVTGKNAALIARSTLPKTLQPHSLCLTLNQAIAESKQA